jgi:alpha-beta hydrolase superfamily lysophospholipase
LFAEWFAAGRSRGVLVVAHGVGDHAGRYESLAQELSGPDGVADVLLFDQTGHGRTPGRRGVVGSYEVLVEDLGAAVEEARRRRPGLPVVVLGHSNGGQVALRLLERSPGILQGLILSNPAFAVTAPIAWHRWVGGHVLRWLAPWATLSGQVDAAWLSRDPSRQAARRADPLIHSRIQPKLFLEMIRGGGRILRELRRVEVPVLMILGLADPLIDARAAADWHERLSAPRKDLLAFEEGVHEPLDDLDRDRVREEIGRWLRQILPERGEGQA